MRKDHTVLNRREGTLSLVMDLPSPWPPASEIELHRVKGDESLSLSADTKGRLTLRFWLGEFSSPRLHVQGSGRTYLVIRWHEGSVSLRLHGNELPLNDANAAPVVLMDDKTLSQNVLIFPGLTPERASTPEECFLSTVADLDRKLVEGSHYSLIRAAGLLRQLLLDQVPLVEEINRTHRISLHFEVVDYNHVPPIAFDHHWRFIDPPEPGRGVTVRGLRGILRVPIYRSGDGIATVRDVIRACANAKGGVHYGPAQGTKERDLLEWDLVAKFFGREPSVAAVVAVGKVVLKGLRPLVEAVLGGAGPREASPG